MACPHPPRGDGRPATPSSTALVFALAFCSAASAASAACGGDPQPATTQAGSGSLVDATLPEGASNLAAEGGGKAAVAADAEAGALPTTGATGGAGGDGSPGADSLLDGSSADVSPAAPGTVTLSRSAAPTPVSPFAYGQNYWNWVDWSHNGVTGLTGTEALVAALHLDVLRAGGINNDENTPQPFDAAQIDRYVAYCRTIGAEPILQVPIVFNPIDGGATSARTAADMVTYANVTKGYGIQYWEIGNEPDSYDLYFDAGVPLNAADHCAVFSSYAAAMRAANAAAAAAPPLRIVGPDLAWKYIPGHDWLTPFLDGCKNDVDVVSVHRYPFNGAQLTPAGALADDARFRADVAVVRAIVQAHARPGTPLAITESNVSYDYAPAKYADAARPAEPGTFVAALWTADALGVALESGLWSFALWNLGERSGGSVLGFLVNTQPTPQYYALKLFTTNVTGTMLSSAGAPAGVSVYASHDTTQAVTVAVVVNKTTSASALTLAPDAAPKQSFDFPGSSISVVRLPDTGGGATHVTEYTQAMAAAGQPPAQVR